MHKPVWDLKAQYDKNTQDDCFDCLIAESLLNEGRTILPLDETLREYKVNSLAELASQQVQKLQQKEKLWELFNRVEMPLTEVLFNMEQTGITLDTKRLAEIGVELTDAIAALQKEILSYINQDINLNSSQQVGTFLAEKEGVPLGKTKTGKYATNETELLKFAHQFAIIQKILYFREITKLKSTYVDSLIEKVAKDGRIHTTYHQVGIATGRLASSNPNLQNIPDNSEFGNKIKSCFIAKEGTTLISFDYSQQELRILAHITGEEKLIIAFNNNEDVHIITASQLFNVEREQVTKEQRAVGKTINFGIIYGMSGFGLSQALHIPESDAQQFIKNFFANFPAIKRYYDSYIKEGIANGYVETILGRRRYIFSEPGQKFVDNATRRMLLNFPIQGSAADLMKKAMVEVQEKILDFTPGIHLLLQIHDDLVFEVPDAHTQKQQEFIDNIKNLMCQVYPLKVPMAVEVKMGKKWGALVPLITTP